MVVVMVLVQLFYVDAMLGEKGGGHSPRRELRSGSAGARCLKLHSKPLVNLCLEHLHPGTIDGALQWQVNHAGAEGKDALTPGICMSVITKSVSAA